MWPFSSIRQKIITLTQLTVREELRGESLTFLSAKNLVEIFDMRLTRMETEYLVRLDALEERIQALENDRKSDEEG